MKKRGAIIKFIVVALLFILASYLAQRYMGLLMDMAGAGISGIVIYILLLVVAIVLAPVTTLPLLPFAATTWGWFWAAIYSIIGWTLGGIIAFWLARHYGQPLIKKIASWETIKGLEERIPRGNLFWSVVFLRMVIPVDVLSYALGLFSTMKLVKYGLATLIGVAPFAFALSYVGTMPLPYQLGALFLAGLLLWLGWRRTSHNA